MEKEQFDVYCVNTGKTIRVNGGESLLEIYKLANPRLAHRPICAYVNNKTFILFLFLSIIYIEVIIKYYLCGESLHDNKLLTIQ